MAYTKTQWRMNSWFRLPFLILGFLAAIMLAGCGTTVMRYESQDRVPRRGVRVVSSGSIGPVLS